VREGASMFNYLIICNVVQLNNHLLLVDLLARALPLTLDWALEQLQKPWLVMAIWRLEKCGLLALAGGINLLGTFADYVSWLIHKCVIPLLDDIAQPMTLRVWELRFNLPALSDFIREILRLPATIPACLMRFCSGLAHRNNLWLFWGHTHNWKQIVNVACGLLCRLPWLGNDHVM
jgi:hypothetical protein